MNSNLRGELDCFICDDTLLTHDSATELFAFQSTKAKSSQRSTVPPAIASWPALPPDPLAASIAPSNEPGTKERSPGEELDQADDANTGSILAVADDQGAVYPLLDGSFPFGPFSAGHGSGTRVIASLFKDAQSPTFRIHHRISVGNADYCELLPTTIHLPLMAQRTCRDEAKISSTARELVWYLIRSIKEMRTAWHGSDTVPGASDFGPRWERLLREKQQNQFGRACICDPSVKSRSDIALTYRANAGRHLRSHDTFSHR
jgi:anaphase-promoting complex subunit 4